MARLKDLKPIRGAKLSPTLRLIATDKATSKVRKRKPRATVRAPRTIRESADRQRLEASVRRARKHPPKADTGDTLKGAKPKRSADSVKRELEGRGVLASVSDKVARVVVKQPQLRTAFKAAGIIPGLGGLDERLVKDIVNLPAQAVPSAYIPAAAVVEAVRGRPQRVRQLAKDIQRSDPVYATGEAVVKGVTGDAKGARKAIKRAGHLASEHPGFTAAEVVGAKGTGARAVTRVQEAAGRRPTARPSARVPGTDLVQPRSYSRDVATRQGQRMRERNLKKRAREKETEALVLEARNPGAHADRIDSLRAEARRIDPERMKPGEIRKRASERVAVNETIRRENRMRVGREVVDAVSPRRGRVRRQKATAATSLAAQAITDASRADLVKYRAEIARQYEGLSDSGRKANRQLQAQIQKAIDEHPGDEHVARTAEAYGRIVRPRTQGLVDRGMLPKESAEKAPLVPYAVRRMGAQVTPDGPVDPKTGHIIPAVEIRAHMKAHGVPEPAYVTQAPRGGSSAYFVSSDRPQSVQKIRRTGGATVKGTFRADPKVLAETAARAQGLIDAHDGFTATIREFAHKPTLGRLTTKKAADNMARELSAKTGVEYRPVRINPFAGRQEQLQALLDSASGEGIEQQAGQLQPIREAMEGAFKGDDGPGPWALIPRHAADEFAAHMQKMGVGPTGKTAQLVTQSFRRAVLATSPTWFAGNLVEASLRGALARAGPSSYKLGRDVLAEVDRISPMLGQELRARATGGGHFKSADTLHVRRGHEQFAGTTMEPMANALYRFWQAPGPRQTAQVWNRWTDLVFRQLNGRIESAFQTAMLGRALRDSPLMDNGLPKLSARAVEQAARGLANTNEQAALARQVERMYGKYNAFNAGTRWAIAMYTPFIPWTLNAIKFVGDVLPRDHPTVTALIAASEQATDEWRKDHGLDLFIDEALPGFLQGSIPTGGGGHQRAPFRYTPFGAFGDPLDTAAKAVLPQYQGVLAAFKGEDWKGAKLRNKDGSEMDDLGKAGMAAQSFAEATVPVLGIAKRVAQKGPAALNPVATVKPAKAKVRAAPPAGSDPVQKAIDRALGGSGGAVQRHIDSLIGG